MFGNLNIFKSDGVYLFENQYSAGELVTDVLTERQRTHSTKSIFDGDVTKTKAIDIRH
jgi:hypothetical protein